MPTSPNLCFKFIFHLTVSVYVLCHATANVSLDRPPLSPKYKGIPNHPSCASHNACRGNCLFFTLFILCMKSICFRRPVTFFFLSFSSFSLLLLLFYWFSSAIVFSLQLSLSPSLFSRDMDLKTLQGINDLSNSPQSQNSRRRMSLTFCVRISICLQLQLLLE